MVSNIDLTLIREMGIFLLNNLNGQKPQDGKDGKVKTLNG